MESVPAESVPPVVEPSVVEPPVVEPSVVDPVVVEPSVTVLLGVAPVGAVTSFVAVEFAVGSLDALGSATVDPSAGRSAGALGAVGATEAAVDGGAVLLGAPVVGFVVAVGVGNVPG